MAEMKFKFTIQPYQTEAVDSVVGGLGVCSHGNIKFEAY